MQDTASGCTILEGLSARPASPMAGEMSADTVGTIRVREAIVVTFEQSA
jgi:hypothetical protein